jgi:hypothetical protein
VADIGELTWRKPTARKISCPEPLASSLSSKRLLHKEGMKAVMFLGLDDDREAEIVAATVTVTAMISGWRGESDRSRGELACVWRKQSARGSL